MPLPGISAEFTNWSMTERSACSVVPVRDCADIMQALDAARAHGLSVIPRGAGHSYTDAALNTNGIVLDVTCMRRILAWDPQRGIMQVEPGVTVREMVYIALADGWWPAVTPSTAEATIGGCVAMNVTGKNAWKCGAFGEHLLSLTVLLATGHKVILSPEHNPRLFQAFVGSAGLLGMILSVTLQLQRITSASVAVRARPAASLGEILALFQEEQAADLLEAWVDGFAGGHQLGRGILTCTQFNGTGDGGRPQAAVSRLPDPLAWGLARGVGMLCRPVVSHAMHLANSVTYWWSKRWDSGTTRQRSLFHSTFYSPAAFAGYHAVLPHGIETFQAFVPRDQAEALFTKIIRCSQANHFIPLWCIIKQHRPDPFLLSYQVDGFSLELNYQIVPQTVHSLREMLQELMQLVIVAGGKFYLAKDALLTHALYRQSVGDAALEAFLHLKQMYDPGMLFQSNLFRRVFQASPQRGEAHCCH